jgi:hypothetical protein
MVRDRSCAARALAVGESSDARKDFIGGFRPHERLQVGLVRIDEGLNGRLELRHAAKCPAPDCLVVSSALQDTRKSRNLEAEVTKSD